jgi:hypothetical protein
MPKIAHAEPNSVWRLANEPFHFGEDGTRQVTEGEAQLLLQAAELSGFKVEITEEKPKKEKEKP